MRSKMRIVGTEKPAPHPLLKPAWAALKKALNKDPESLVIVCQKHDGEIYWESAPDLLAVPDSLIRAASDLMCGEPDE